MKPLLRFAALVSSLVLASTPCARTAVLDFEDLAPASFNLPNHYGGFEWMFFGYKTYVPPSPPQSGYDVAAASGRAFVYNTLERSPVLSDSVFDFVGANLTSAYRDNLQIRVTGLRGSAELFSRTVVANVTSPSWFDFNFQSIDSLLFEPFGGAAHPGFSSAGHYFGMDDFTFVVPEPRTFPLLAIGALGLCFARLRTGMRKDHQRRAW
jgi:hypothetical protein